MKQQAECRGLRLWISGAKEVPVSGATPPDGVIEIRATVAGETECDAWEWRDAKGRRWGTGIGTDGPIWRVEDWKDEKPSDLDRLRSALAIAPQVKAHELPAEEVLLDPSETRKPAVMKVLIEAGHVDFDWFFDDAGRLVDVEATDIQPIWHIEGFTVDEQEDAFIEAGTADDARDKLAGQIPERHRMFLTPRDTWKLSRVARPVRVVRLIPV